MMATKQITFHNEQVLHWLFQLVFDSLHQMHTLNVANKFRKSRFSICRFYSIKLIARAHLILHIFHGMSALEFDSIFLYL